MNIIETIIHNNKINFYLILIIFIIILFFPISYKKTNSYIKYNKVDLSNDIKKFTKYIILN